MAQFLLLLEAHRARCEHQQLYVEAALVADKVQQLRAHEDSRRAHNLAVRHLAERLDLEEAHLLEFDEFGAAWRERFSGPQGFDSDTQQRLQALRARHTEDMEKWTEQEQDQLMMRPKFSKQLLQLRSKQESLARARDYVSAERVRAQAAQLERVELDAMRATFGARAHQKRARFLDTQAKEEAGFLARRAEERAQLEQRKRSELRSLVVQKYANLKSELERSHAKERARLERMNDMGISDSATMREEAPRRVNAAYEQRPSLAPQQGATDTQDSWNAGLAAGAAIMARNNNAAATGHQQQQSQQAQQQNQPQPRSSAGSTSDSYSSVPANATPAQRAYTQAQHHQLQQVGPRRSIEAEQEAMLRGDGGVSGGGSYSSAAEVPTISSALGMGGGAPTPASQFMPPPPAAPAAAAFPSSASQAHLHYSQQPQQPQQQRAYQQQPSPSPSQHSSHSRAPQAPSAPAPSSSQLLQQKHAAAVAAATAAAASAHKPGAMSARTHMGHTSSSYDPLGSARARPAANPRAQRAAALQQQQPQTARPGLPSVSRSGSSALPLTSRHGLAAASQARFTEHKEALRY